MTITDSGSSSFVYDRKECSFSNSHVFVYTNRENKLKTIDAVISLMNVFNKHNFKY